MLCFEFDSNFLNYTSAVDAWAVGCILAEIITGKVLFPGTSFMDQLTVISEKIGRPSPEYIGAIANEDARAFTLSLPEKPTHSLVDWFAASQAETGPINPHAVDLVVRLLDYHPDRSGARTCARVP